MASWRLRIRRHQRTRAVGALGALILATACGQPRYHWRAGTDQGAAEKAGKKKRPKMIQPARLVALPRATNSTFTASEPDGGRRLIVNGMRLLAGADGTLERGAELFPHGRVVVTVELPPRLGGGYAFYVSANGTTLLWRAKTWTGALEPLANLGFEVNRVVPGFDRLYLGLQSSNELVALDPETGKVGDLGALPASPAFGNMAFADQWLGAVEADYRGVLVTFDAGASWRPIGVQTGAPHVALEEGQIVVYTTSGRMALDANGRLRQHGYGSSTDSIFSGAGRVLAPGGFAEPPKKGDKKPLPPTPLGRLPIRQAVLHGWPDSKDTVVVAAKGALGRLRISDGKVLEVKENAYPRGGACHAIRLGAGVGFVCGQERGGTVVYELERPLSMNPVLTFEEPRFVSSSGNGALVVRGTCEAKDDDDPAADSRAYCIRSIKGDLREVRVRGDLGVERVVALRDGRTAVLVPPRRGAAGLLTLVDVNGSAKTVKLKLPKKAGDSMLALLRKGLWLDGFVQVGGSLFGWVAAAGPFAGVRVKLDGKVTVGKMEDDIDRTLVSGRYALAIGRPGLAFETTDGGFKWREIEVPVGMADRGSGLPKLGAAGAAGERGCSPVGCAFGSWMRIGWRGEGKDSKLPVAKEPPPTVLRTSRGGRWLVRCAPTGEASRPHKPSVPKAPAPPPIHRPSPFALAPPGLAPGSALRSSAWVPFFGVAPPPLPRDHVGFDFGTEGHVVAVRGYAWGVKGADWGRVGRWQMRALDRFGVKDAVWSTAVTRTPWTDATSAAQRFGQDPMHGLHAAWGTALDPSGRAGVVAVISRGAQPELFLIEEDRSIIAVGGATFWDVNSLAGAVRAGGAWYIGLGSGSPRTFTVLKITGDRASAFGSYPRQQRSNAPARVVRNARADALGLWIADTKVRGSATSWYVFPIDLRTGRTGEPLQLTPEMLAPTPPPCSPDDDGWVLTGNAPIEPYLDMVPEAGDVRTRSAQVRVLASEHGVCLDALSANLDGPVPTADALRRGSAALSARKASVPLALRSALQRFRFRCSQ